MITSENTLFRKEAIDCYLQGEQSQGLVRITPPWALAILCILLTAICAGIAASFIGSVEITARGRGIIRPVNGIRTMLSQTGGSVQSILVQSGQKVKKGTVLLNIDAPQLRSEFLSAEREYSAVMSDFKPITKRQESAYREQSLRLKKRLVQLRQLLESQNKSIGVYQRHLEARINLFRDSVISEVEVDQSREELAQAQRQAYSTQQSIDQTKQERAAIESSRQSELWQIQQVVENASNKKDAIAQLCKQSVVVAPEDGTVEALLVKQGEVIGSGQAVCKLIPGTTPLHVISFLLEKDRAFIKNGDMVHLELDQLPYSEFGTLKGRITRISNDLASPFEIVEALGENQQFRASTFRIEITIDDSTAAKKADILLRSGMLMNVRFTLRKQRLITIVIDPLRKWFK
jgi:membrane fusion protein